MREVLHPPVVRIVHLRRPAGSAHHVVQPLQLLLQAARVGVLDICNENLSLQNSKLMWATEEKNVLFYFCIVKYNLIQYLKSIQCGKLINPLSDGGRH